MIPTEDEPERVRRRHVVLRPRHLSPALVSNALLKRVTAGDRNFAHADAVEDMSLESCLDLCPVEIILDCIRIVLDQGRASEGGALQAAPLPRGGCVAGRPSCSPYIPTPSTCRSHQLSSSPSHRTHLLAVVVPLREVAVTKGKYIHPKENLVLLLLLILAINMHHQEYPRRCMTLFA